MNFTVKAHKNQVNPSFLLLPLTITVSLAFLLPVATPTNAVVFASGYIRIKDMVISGLVLKLFGVIVVMFISNTWLGLIFHDPTLKDAIALQVNETLATIH